jgi:23S rRNA (adenine2503-C2)-methyltransferase
MPGINDSIEDVSRIRDFCAPMNRTMVNLIPYNPGSLPLTRAPEEHEIERFVGWLRDEGLSVRRRITKGRDVMAACGQLGNLELRRSKRALPLSPATRRGDQSDETTTQPPSER